MNKTLFLIPLAGVLQLGDLPEAYAQDMDKNRRVRIEIVTTENGGTKRVTHEFDAADEEEMQQALKDLGILDHFNLNGDDRDMEIDIRRFGGPQDMEELSLLLAPKAPDLPDAPAPPLGLIGEPKGYLGVASSYMSEEQARTSKAPGGKGAVVTEVLNGTAAEKLDLKEGDVIVQVGGTMVSDPETLREAVREHEPGSKVKVVWYRMGKKMNGTAELTASNDHAYAFDAAPEHGSEGWDWEDYLGDADAMRKRAFLGVTPGEGEGKGARIGRVDEGSAADNMGIQDGDVITRVNEIMINDFADLSRTIKGMKPGDQVTVVVERGTTPITLHGTLGERSFGKTITIDPSQRFRSEGFAPADRDVLFREMDQLRKEMDRMRRDLGQDLRSETRIRIERKPLSTEEKAMLKNKGVHTLDNALDLGDLGVFPNPSNGFFRIHFDVAEKGDLSVNVHDAQGEKVYEERITAFKGRYERTLDLSDKASGTYFLVIEQGGRSVAEKLVKE